MPINVNDLRAALREQYNVVVFNLDIIYPGLLPGVLFDIATGRLRCRLKTAQKFIMH